MIPHHKVEYSMLCLVSRKIIHFVFQTVNSFWMCGTINDKQENFSIIYFSIRLSNIFLEQDLRHSYLFVGMILVVYTA